VGGRREKFILHRAKMLFREPKGIRNINVRMYTGEVFALQAASTDILKYGKDISRNSIFQQNQEKLSKVA